jgi:hypothetical protein
VKKCDKCRGSESETAMDNSFKKNSKIIETVNYNGKYIDASTVRNKAISVAIALVALVASFCAFFLL